MTSETMIQTQSQSSVAHALEAIGCKIEENIGSAGILFVYGGAYYIVSTPDDLSYVCIHFPRFGDLSDFPSHQSADSAIHGQNARIKLARVWVDGDQLHASAETLLDPSMHLAGVFERLLKLIQLIVFEIRVSQRKASPQEGKSMADKLPAETSPQSIALH